MDFFDRQDKARRNTKLLVVYFTLAVLLLILSVYIVFVLLISRKDPWNPELLLWVALGTTTVVALGSLFKTLEMKRGGSAVAEMLGGELLNPNTTNPDERKILNVVEEMALASGMPVPPVYILRQEQAINAFAAGHTTNDAAIGVTSGCVRLLNRDELQGVIAHEFSHILNGDMRLNIRLIGIIFGILCLAVIGRILIHVRGSGRDRNPLPLIGLALLLLGWIGVFFGRLIQAAVSRQREFLADAAAVQFTRNPEGIAGALKKIGGLTYGSKLESKRADEASHMFFGNGLSRPISSLFATHPPLTRRIQAIDPGFDGSFPPVTLPELPPRLGDTAKPGKAQGFPFPFPFPGTGQKAASFSGSVGPVIAAAVLPGMGTPSNVHLLKAAEIRDSLSPRLQDAVRDSLGASAAIYAQLLSRDPQVRGEQLEVLSRELGAPMQTEVIRLSPDVQELPAEFRLPLVDLAIPGLRELSPAQFQKFRSTIRRLAEVDGKIDLFEYALLKVVLHHLAPHFEPEKKPVTQFYALKGVLPDIEVVLSAMAYAGHKDNDRIQSAFEQGAGSITRVARVPLRLLPQSGCSIEQVDPALDRLSRAVPQIKKHVLTACAHAVAADGKIDSREAELLRAISETLDCPLPPFVN